MDPRVQKTVIPYDVEALKGSILKHENNIDSMEKAISSERDRIVEEQDMIRTLENRARELEDGV